ncbi:MAG: hypothetical protein HQK54_03480 [Oligoflexales bacterium]|nr:hypothetical protein [Oligoflexales bacterium]
MKKIFGCICFAVIVNASELYGYQVKCNEDQSICQVETKRLAKGDRVGIFSKDGYIVALGIVAKIIGEEREIKITKKYEEITASCELEKIQDNEANSPGKFFKIRQSLKKRQYGGGLGLASIGVGSGFQAFMLEGFMEWLMKNSWYAGGRALILKGSGTASITLDQLEERKIDMMALGLMGGAGFDFIRNENFTVKGEADLGVANVSASSSGDEPVKEVADGRIFAGIGVLVKAELEMLFNWNEMQPYGAFSMIRLQNSNNYAFSFGIISSF